MKTSLTLITLGFYVNLVFNLLVFANQTLFFIGWILLPFTLANIIGVVLLCNKQKALGAKLFMISSYFFIPTGIIGVVGAKKVIEEVSKQKYYESL